jgi:LemA protein
MKAALAIIGLIVAGVIGLVLMIGMWVLGEYNGIVALDQKAIGAWGQVQNVYQRRADLVPQLVGTVQGAASFEKETLTAVIEARASVGRVTVKADENMFNDAEKMKKFMEAQNGLSQALSRLMVISEQYPQLRATENFTMLQASLEGTENRIAVERGRFNEIVTEYNTRIKKIPGSFVAGFGGFTPKPFFEASDKAQEAPKVEFSFQKK